MSKETPEPPLRNPVRGTSVDTSLQLLGLEQAADEANSSLAPTPGAPKTKTMMKRVEQTAAKLGGSVLGTGSNPKRDSNAPQQAQPQQQPQQQSSHRLSVSLTGGTPRRFLSLSRKGKGKEREVSGESTGAYWFQLVSVFLRCCRKYCCASKLEATTC